MPFFNGPNNRMTINHPMSGYNIGIGAGLHKPPPGNFVFSGENILMQSALLPQKQSTTIAGSQSAIMQKNAAKASALDKLNKLYNQSMKSAASGVISK